MKRSIDLTVYCSLLSEADGSAGGLVWGILGTAIHAFIHV